MNCEVDTQPANIEGVKELKTWKQVREFVMGEEMFQEIEAGFFDWNGTLNSEKEDVFFPIHGLQALSKVCLIGMITGSGPYSFASKIVGKLKNLLVVPEKTTYGEIFPLGVVVNHGPVTLDSKSEIGTIISKGLKEELFSTEVVEKLTENIKKVLNDQNKWPGIEWVAFYPSLKHLDQDESIFYNYVYYAEDISRLDKVAERYNDQVILLEDVKKFSNLLLELNSSKLVIKLEKSGSLDGLKETLLEGIGEDEIRVEMNRDEGDGKGERMVILPPRTDKLSVMQKMIDKAGLNDVSKIYFGNATNDFESLVEAKIGVIVGKKEWELTRELTEKVLEKREKEGKEGLLLVVHPEEVDFMLQVLAAAIRLGNKIGEIEE